MLSLGAEFAFAESGDHDGSAIRFGIALDTTSFEFASFLKAKTRRISSLQSLMRHAENNLVSKVDTGRMGEFMRWPANAAMLPSQRERLGIHHKRLISALARELEYLCTYSERRRYPRGPEGWDM